MHLEKHSKFQCETYQIFFLTTYKIYLHNLGSFRVVIGHMLLTSNFVKKSTFFQVLHYMALYMNVTKQWPLETKTNFALIKVQSLFKSLYLMVQP
jgi:hypothetical protein